MTYFHRRTSTIIGAKAFHGPVRDGKAWDHLAMVVKRKRLPGWCLGPTWPIWVRSTAGTQRFSWCARVCQRRVLCWGCVVLRAWCTAMLRSAERHLNTHNLQGYRIKPHGQLVLVSFTHYCASTPSLSTSWSRTTLQGALGPGIPNLQTSFPLRCLQRLSLPYLATRQCHWHDNRYTSGTSTPVLSY